MTLQQLQKMAERQRTQILRNNQELIAKQQRLMEMQSGMKKQSQVSQKPNTNDAYATKLRETYQSHLSRLRDMKMVQDEVDSKRFNNIELGLLIFTIPTYYVQTRQRFFHLFSMINIHQDTATFYL